MFSHNKFLFFLIACMIANPCFAGGILSNVNKSGINTKLIHTDPIVFPSYSLDICNCPKNYYVSKCGDMDLDLGTINALVRGKHSIEGNTCWNDSFTDMHYLLHLEQTADINTLPSGGSWSLKPNACGTNITDSQTIVSKLQNVRINVYDACLSSCTCQQCPNGGVTDSETELAKDTDGALVTPKRWASFNTIADCYIKSGSDDRGTFTLQNTSDRCYYSYSE